MTALAEPTTPESWMTPRDPAPTPPLLDPDPRIVVVVSAEARDCRPLRRALWELWREIGRPVTLVCDPGPSGAWAREWAAEHSACGLRCEPQRLWSGVVTERVRAAQALARSRPPLVVAALAGHAFYERMLVDECTRLGVPVRVVEGA